MHDIDEDCTFLKDLKGISMDKTVVDYKFLHGVCSFKQEYAPDAPAIYGIRPVTKSDG